ncbi:hypothetical protein ACFYY5_29125 [Nocardia elegans]|uniref:DUF1146 domain-containing protein n=1 Tax=Nocardia elegans TaxID=300029 RepID=A0ABW6TNZ5_9NOCA
MTIAYWVTIGALATTIILARLNIRHEDTWGDRLLPWARLSTAVTVLAGVVFVAWFGLDTLSIHITRGN